MMTCTRCQKRGQTWKGDPPRCGFVDGVFTSDNWNCATLDDLRVLVDTAGASVYVDDYTGAILPAPESEFTTTYYLLCWYKNRGRIEFAMAWDGPEVRPLTLLQADKLLTKWGV